MEKFEVTVTPQLFSHIQIVLLITEISGGDSIYNFKKKIVCKSSRKCFLSEMEGVNIFPSFEDANFQEILKSERKNNFL